jgi:hypothetical protein
VPGRQTGFSWTPAFAAASVTSSGSSVSTRSASAWRGARRAIASKSSSVNTLAARTEFCFLVPTFPSLTATGKTLRTAVSSGQQ